MNKTRIDWADYSWNPIKGLCPEGCWYCYARAMYRRFKMESAPSFDKGELMAPIYSHPNRPAGSRIFVCSTFELFSPAADPWRDDIFKVIEFGKRDTFIILTKRPERIDRVMPPNVWLGVSIEGAEDSWRIEKLGRAQADVKFVSLEPFLGTTPQLGGSHIDWLIIGRLTGRGNKHDPEPNALAQLFIRAKARRIPIFVKSNLKGIWPGPLIQEFPEERR